MLRGKWINNRLRYFLGGGSTENAWNCSIWKCRTQKTAFKSKADHSRTLYTDSFFLLCSRDFDLDQITLYKLDPAVVKSCRDNGVSKMVSSLNVAPRKEKGLNA